MSIRTAVADGLADDPAVDLVSPRQLAGLGVYGFKPAVHAAVENQITAGYYGTGPHRKVFLHHPDWLALHRIPRRQLAAVTPGARLHMHLGANVGSALDVAHLHAHPIHAHIL